MTDRSLVARLLRFVVAALLLCALAGSAVAAEEVQPAGKEAPKVTYDEHIKPIFRQHCFACHNPDKKTNGLDLTAYSTAMQGGSSGEAIEPGSPDFSYLFLLVSHQSEPHMPPKSEKLPDEQIALIRRWIDGGALENTGSKPIVTNKPKIDISLPSAPTDRPEGPPPLPYRLGLQPLVHTEHATSVTALATNPWSPLVAVAGQTQVLLYHAQTLQLLGALPFPDGVPYVLKFSRNGSLLLAGGGRGGASGRVVVWNVRTGERVLEVGDEFDAVLAADLSADQTKIALGGPGRVVRVYSTKDGKLLYELRKHTEWIYAVAFSPDGVLLATADRNGGMFVWEALTGREYLSLKGHTGPITDLSWRPDSNVLASCSEDGSIRLWEMQNGNQIKSWGAHGGGAASVEFTRDGRLVSCGRDKVAKLWDQNGNQQRAFPAFADIAVQVTHSDETNRVIAADWTGTTRVWNAADGTQVGELTANPPKLEERLNAATAQQQAAQKDSDQKAAAYQSAQAALDKVTADLAAANQSAAELQKQSEQQAKAIEDAKKSIAGLTAERDAASKAVAALEPVIPPLTESLAKAQEAAGKAPGDKELADLAAQVKTQLDKKTAQLNADQKTLAEKTDALKKTQQQLTAVEKQLGETKTALEAARKRVEELSAKSKPAQEQAAAAQTARDQAAQVLASARQNVERWQGEIAFEQKLQTLKARQQEHQNLLAAAQTAEVKRDAAKTELANAQGVAADLQKQAEAAAKTLNDHKTTVSRLAGEKQAAEQGIAALEAALPLLKETLAKGQQAAEKAPKDKDLADAAGQLKALVDKKTGELESLRKTLVEKTAALTAAQQQVTAAEKQVNDVTAAFTEAQKRVAEKEAAVKTLEQQAASARQTAEAAKQTVDAAQQEVDRLRNPPQAVEQARAG